MKVIQLLPILIFVFTCVSSCKKDVDKGDDDNKISLIIEEQNKRLEKVVSADKVSIVLRVKVEDENGQALSGVELKVGNKIATTDDEGVCLFQNIQVNKDFAFISAAKTGYFNGSRTISATPGAINSAEIILLKKGIAKQFNAQNGGSLKFDDNRVGIEFPANAIADAQGQPYKGNVQVYARYLDPSTENFGNTMPGNLVGLTQTNNLSGMVSYGMLNVEMRDASNNPLQLLGGQTAEVTMPAVSDAPEDMPFWHFNEFYGLWVEVGRAKKEGASYRFEANHFSVWNLDVMVENPVPEVTIQVVDKALQPIGNLKVEIYNSEFRNLYLAATTDEQGRIRLLYAPAVVGLRLKSTCRSIDRIVPLAEPVVRIVLGVADQLNNYNIVGQMKDCDNELYKNAPYFLKSIDNKNMQFIGITDNQGGFSTNSIVCDIDPNQSYLLIAQVLTGENTFKQDTISVIFNTELVETDIDFCEVEEEEFSGSFTDPRDGQTYKVVKIGSQIWFAENLRYAGSIPNITDTVVWWATYTPAWCYYNNDTSFNSVYGKMYNWFAVSTGSICPAGWHVPSKDEYEILYNYLGGKDVAGGKMKSTGTLEAGTGLWKAPNEGATNESGYSAQPGGWFLFDQKFGNMNVLEQCWTSSQHPTPELGYTAFLLNRIIGAEISNYNKRAGFYCRCIKD